MAVAMAWQPSMMTAFFSGSNPATADLIHVTFLGSTAPISVSRQCRRPPLFILVGVVDVSGINDHKIEIPFAFQQARGSGRPGAPPPTMTISWVATGLSA